MKSIFIYLSLVLTAKCREPPDPFNYPYYEDIFYLDPSLISTIVPHWFTHNDNHSLTRETTTTLNLTRQQPLSTDKWTTPVADKMDSSPRITNNNYFTSDIGEGFMRTEQSDSDTEGLHSEGTSATPQSTTGHVTRSTEAKDQPSTVSPSPSQANLTYVAERSTSLAPTATVAEIPSPSPTLSTTSPFSSHRVSSSSDDRSTLTSERAAAMATEMVTDEDERGHSVSSMTTSSSPRSSSRFPASSTVFPVDGSAANLTGGNTSPSKTEENATESLTTSNSTSDVSWVPSDPTLKSLPLNITDNATTSSDMEHTDYTLIARISVWLNGGTALFGKTLGRGILGVVTSIGSTTVSDRLSFHRIWLLTAFAITVDFASRSGVVAWPRYSSLIANFCAVAAIAFHSLDSAVTKSVIEGTSRNHWEGNTWHTHLIPFTYLIAALVTLPMWLMDLPHTGKWIGSAVYCVWICACLSAVSTVAAVVSAIAARAVKEQFTTRFQEDPQAKDDMAALLRARHLSALCAFLQGCSTVGVIMANAFPSSRSANVSLGLAVVNAVAAVAQAVYSGNVLAIALKKIRKVFPSVRDPREFEQVMDVAIPMRNIIEEQ